MRARNAFRTAALTLVATLVTATALYAAGPRAGVDPTTRADRTGRWESHLQQKLGLTDDQLQAIRQVYATRDVDAQRQHARALRTAQAELRRLALNGADDATLAAKQAEVQNLLAQSTQARVETLRQVGPILNADQREAFAKMIGRGPHGRHHRGASRHHPS